MELPAFIKINNKGMTLIEMMIALMILLITSLAMMQTGLLAMQTNMVNSLRDEAVSVAEARMDELRNLQFDAVTSGGTWANDSTVERRVRASAIYFVRRMNVVDIDLYTKQVTVEVTWQYRSKDYMHIITTILRTHS